MSKERLEENIGKLLTRGYEEIQPREETLQRVINHLKDITVQNQVIRFSPRSSSGLRFASYYLIAVGTAAVILLAASWFLGGQLANPKQYQTPSPVPEGKIQDGSVIAYRLTTCTAPRCNIGTYLKRDDILLTGDTLEAGENGANLVLNNNIRIRLEGNSLLTINGIPNAFGTPTPAQPSDGGELWLTLNKGEMLVEVTSPDGHRDSYLCISTPAGTVIPMGTKFKVSAQPDLATNPASAGRPANRIETVVTVSVSTGAVRFIKAGYSAEESPDISQRNVNQETIAAGTSLSFRVASFIP